MNGIIRLQFPVTQHDNLAKIALGGGLQENVPWVSELPSPCHCGCNQGSPVGSARLPTVVHKVHTRAWGCVCVCGGGSSRKEEENSKIFTPDMFPMEICDVQNLKLSPPPKNTESSQG